MSLDCSGRATSATRTTLLWRPPPSRRQPTEGGVTIFGSATMKIPYDVRGAIMSESPLMELLFGKGAHTSPLACIEDLSCVLACSAVSGFPHSIWQILRHLNYWMDYELKRIDGHAKPYPQHAVDSWPVEPKPASETEWRGELLLFSKHLQEMWGLAESNSEVLTQPVEITTPAHAQQSNSVHAVLWQTVVHNSYHVGQIVLLRRCLNAWPPKGGGDSW